MDKYHGFLYHSHQPSIHMEFEIGSQKLCVVGCCLYCGRGLTMYTCVIVNNISASKQAYRPPSARGKEINFKLHDDDDVPSAVSETACKCYL